MREPAFTRGPWAFALGQPYVTKDWHGKARPIASIIEPIWHEDFASAAREAGANANLIAAAPALYEALQVAQQRECSSWCDRTINEHTSHCKAQCAALKLARGEIA